MVRLWTSLDPVGAVPARERKPEKKPAHVTERQPRLVLRFAVVTALSLGLGGAAILIFTRHLNTLQAEGTAAKHAQFVAEDVLSDRLRASDFERPVTASRRGQLDRLFRRKVLRPGTVLVTLSRADRLVTYSTDHNLIGHHVASAARTNEALSGTVTSEVTSIRGTDSQGGWLKVLRSYVPISAGKGRGVVAIHQDYGPIEKAARAALLPVAGILEVVLVLLFALLVPLLVRVTRRLRRHADKIQYQALHDELTGLPNRLQFRNQISGALEAKDGGHLAVLVLDLDRFKEINETLGHQSGDELLEACAARLRELTPAGAMLARLGGDEFGVVGPGMTSGEAAALAEDIRASLQVPFVVRDIPLVVEASFGISVYPDNGRDVDEILQTADAAMYVAKDRRVGVALYDGTPEQSTSDALTLVSELRPALERKELVLHFQPQIAVETGAVTGAEALIRWQHPERGLLQPGAFVPYVERTGAIKELSEYVLAEATGQLRTWRDHGFEIGVAVNLTMFDLLDTKLPGKIADLLERSGVEPHRLELEITESLIMGDPQRVREVVERLKEIGVRLAIDDFGTGYSSLSYLKTLPIDVIKIDRSFVMAMGTNESDAAIVLSTIDLAHNLDLRVVAEGVEDAQALDQLGRYGCDYAQGYYISRPCEPTEFWTAVAAFAEQRAVA
jgi:diguanylate cyclase (GGDEF)-like protein